MPTHVRSAELKLGGVRP